MMKRRICSIVLALSELGVYAVAMTATTEDFDPEFEDDEADFEEGFFYRDEKLREHEDWFRGDR